MKDNAPPPLPKLNFQKKTSKILQMGTCCSSLPLALPLALAPCLYLLRGTCYPSPSLAPSKYPSCDSIFYCPLFLLSVSPSALLSVSKYPSCDSIFCCPLFLLSVRPSALSSVSHRLASYSNQPVANFECACGYSK